MAAVVFVTTSMITWLSSYFEVTRGLAPGKAGTLSGPVMGLAIVVAPPGGYLADCWRKFNITLYPFIGHPVVISGVEAL